MNLKDSKLPHSKDYINLLNRLTENLEEWCDGLCKRIQYFFIAYQLNPLMPNCMVSEQKDEETIELNVRTSSNYYSMNPLEFESKDNNEQIKSNENSDDEVELISTKIKSKRRKTGDTSEIIVIND